MLYCPAAPSRPGIPVPTQGFPPHGVPCPLRVDWPQPAVRPASGGRAVHWLRFKTLPLKPAYQTDDSSLGSPPKQPGRAECSFPAAILSGTASNLVAQSEFPRGFIKFGASGLVPQRAKNQKEVKSLPIVGSPFFASTVISAEISIEMNIGSPIARFAARSLRLRTAILLVDSDLGFVFWLGRELDRAGYEAFPARSVPDALKLIAELHLSVGLVILSDSLPGAPKLISTLRQAQSHPKIILLVENAHEPHHVGVDAQCVRPGRICENSRAEWLQMTQRVLSRKATA